MNDLTQHSPGQPSTAQLIAFAGPAVPLMMLFAPLINYLPTLYVSEIGLSLYWIGFAFMVARLWDGLTDPIVGALSDRTHHRFGKRKVWMLAGLIPFVISVHFLLNPQPGSGVGYLVVWLTLFYVCWTVMLVPYLSWGAELSDSYRGRSRVFGFRETGTTAGIFLSAAIPIVFLSDTASMSEILALLSKVVIVLSILTVLVAMYFVGERSSQVQQENSSGGFRALIDALRVNRPYLRFILFVLVFFTGINMSNTVVVLLVQQRLGLENAFLEMVFILYTTTIVSMPLVVKLAHRIGRHRVLSLGVLTMAASVLLLAAVPINSYWAAATCFMLLGIGNATAWAMPPAIIGDLSDFGAYKGQGENMGAYMAGYNMMMKLAMALGVGIALPLLDFLGFSAEAGTQQQNAQALVIVGCFIAAFVMSASVALIWNFPIDAKRHRVIRKYLKRLRQASSLSNY